MRKEAPVKVRYSEELCPRCRDMVNEKERAIVQVRSVVPINDHLRRLVIDITRKEAMRVKRGVVF
jgi:hypothetical protein